MVDSYKGKNRQSSKLEIGLFNEMSVTLISKDDVIHFLEISEKNELKAEDAFHNKFGSRDFIYFSRPGFNRKLDRALINVTYAGICRTCSESYFFVLTRMNGKWIFLSKTVAWMS